MTRSKISSLTFLLIVMLIVSVSGLSAATGQETQARILKKEKKLVLEPVLSFLINDCFLSDKRMLEVYFSM